MSYQDPVAKRKQNMVYLHNYDNNNDDDDDKEND